MADFCKQCSEYLFGTDGNKNDFVGLCTVDDNAEGKYAVVLCEGCGPCQVDHNGECISEDCIEKHGMWEMCSINPCELSNNIKPDMKCKHSIVVNGKKACGYG